MDTPASLYKQLDHDFTGIDDPAAPVNIGTSPMDAAAHLDAAYNALTTNALDDLERLTAAAGELYGTALRDQLQRAISPVARIIIVARTDVRSAHRLYCRETERLRQAVAAETARADDLATVVRELLDKPAGPQPGTNTPPAPPADVVDAAERIARILDRRYGPVNPETVAITLDNGDGELAAAVAAWRDAHTRTGHPIEP